MAAEAGLAEIEKVKAGDRVWSFNKDTCQWELKLVERTFVRDYEGDIITLELGESVIESTGNHPFWVVLGEGLAERPQPNLPVQLSQTNHPGRWVEARDLRRGDVLLGKDGQQVVVRGCTSRMDNLPVYNFQVADNHSYAVSKCCVLVHNVCPPQAAKTTPSFYVSPNREVMPATAYRYMDSKYAQTTMNTMEAPLSYFGFEKFNTQFNLWCSLSILCLC